MKQTKQIISRQPIKHVRQEGATLVEGIAYLGIAALVVLGAVSLLTGAFSNAKANQATEEIVALRTAVRKLYIGQAMPATIVADLIAANVAPNTLVRGSNNTTLTNGWGGSVTITANNSEFSISYTLVPQEVCISVVSGANGWTKISGDNGANAFTTFPATVANAKAMCTGTTNTMVFTAI